MNGTPDLAAIFMRAANTLVSDFDAVEFLHTLTEDVAQISGADAVGLMLTDHDGALHYVASSNHEGRALELLQLATGEGPCTDAFTTQTQVAATDLGADLHRWPRFGEQAAAAGYASAHAFPLRVRGHGVGAMGLFATAPTSLDRRDADLVQALADIATVSILHDRTATREDDLTAQLQGTLHSRVVIEQAKGAVSALAQVSVADAFGLLRSHARHHGLRLTDVAARVLDDPRGTAHWWSAHDPAL